MKNIQVIDGADNCTYSIFPLTKEEFRAIFPGRGQDIEFIEDVVERLGKGRAGKLLGPVYARGPLKKSEVRGIHGTLFYELYGKRIYYPTKRDQEMRNPIVARARVARANARAKKRKASGIA